MTKSKYDFGGYATKVDLKCSDGRIIRKDAFAHNDGQVVPLVWQHVHNDVSNVLGHALLENREDGVYAYGLFNDTEAGINAKKMVEHGDITALSIYANGLKQVGPDVIHGAIKEVSLVLAGANPGAFIDNLCISHGDSVVTDDTEAVIFTGENFTTDVIEHKKEDPKVPDTKKPEDPKAAPDGPTIQDVINTMTEEQKNVCYALVSQALEDGAVAQSAIDPEKKEDLNNKEVTKTEDPEINHSNLGGEENMKHNVFDQNNKDDKKGTLSHDDMKAIFVDAKRCGSLRDSVIQHGMTNIDYLFPDATAIDGTPGFISREMGWVPSVMGAVHHTPFSRIKSIFADITEEDARAKGYIKGNLKKEEVFSLLKRTTTPTTVYKKQKLDRDDVVDITDFDVVSWMKTEMRMMLDEELARAILVGDGRLNSSDDKINESNIRPIWKDEDLYAIKAAFDVAANSTPDAKAKAFIRTCIKARKNYKGSGSPSLYTTEDVLTDCLLLEDTTGRIIYDSVDKLATVLRVKEIITVSSMENLSRVVGSDTLTLEGLIVNLVDYNIGADKGGAVNMFDDFDIDYNAQKYLIETRASGALIRPFSAIVIESKPAIAG
jgi:hypothetical protein